MRSPFPGMDPWLEFHWRDVHASLIIYIRDHLQRHLPAPLVARAEETVSVDIEEDKPLLVRPDMAVSEDWRGAGDSGASGGVALAVEPATVADPVVLYAPEIEFDRHVEIYDPTGGGRVVTAIEVLSPSNKLPGRARKTYESKQRLFLSGGVNLVEIDLVREGDWVFSIDESVMPARKRTPYMVCVFRATRPGERAAYPLPLRERLPRIAIPLRPTDRDVVLDLQAVVDEAYEKGRYERTDYRRPLDPPLSAEDSAWVKELLQKAGRL
jgi:hypothetical protein